ncbi:MAG: alpha-amylase family glycosyl hydrolase, partial [Acidimicrobiales bacterium]
MPSPRSLGSTYRLQLHGLGFAGGRSLVDYLHRLGIETLYCSPILAAAAGSTHGYDVIDPTRIDPVLGTEEDFSALLASLAEHGMRLLVDIVPNHLSTSPANPWWWDTLRLGRESPYAGVFDVDWSDHGGRILLPVLGKP